MGFGVELIFDTDSEARIKSLWDVLAEATGNTYLLDSGSRPHISLALFESLEGVDLRDALASFALATAPVSLRLSAVGMFPGAECVMYLAPVVTRGLLDAHSNFYHCLHELPIRSLPYYQPERWIPHCTVAYDVTPRQVGEAVDAICGSGVFGEVRLTEIALVEFEPARHICSFPLTGGD